MEKMHISFIKDLKNREFYVLFNSLEDLLNENGGEDAIIARAAEKIKSHHKQLILLRDNKPCHHLTRVINTKVRNRTEYLACLRMKIEASLLSHKTEERVAAKRLIIWMSPYTKDIHKPTIGVQGQLVKFLMSDRDESKDIQKFITLLDLDELLEVIMDTTTEINKLFVERIKDKTHKAVNGKKVREAAYKDFQLLINAMEVSYNISSEGEEREQIAKLSQLINECLKEFRTELKSRNTKRKNKKEIEVAVKELIEVEAKEDDSSLVVADNQLHINKTHKYHDSSPSQPTTSDSKIENKKVERDKKLNRENGSKGSSPTRIERDSDSEGDMKLPPL